MLAGVPTSAYWTSLFTVYIAIFLTPCCYCLLLILALPIEALAGVAFFPTVLVVLTYVPVAILFAFAVSFLFKDFDTCQSSLPPLLNFFAFIPFIAIGVLDGTGSSDTARLLHFIFCTIDPPYALLGGIYYINRVQLIRSGCFIILFYFYILFIYIYSILYHIILFILYDIFI